MAVYQMGLKDKRGVGILENEREYKWAEERKKRDTRMYFDYGEVDG